MNTRITSPVRLHLEYKYGKLIICCQGLSLEIAGDLTQGMKRMKRLEQESMLRPEEYAFWWH